jgi:peptidoglycan hydrolase-like amidase
VALEEPARGRPLNLEIRVAVERQASRLELSASSSWWLRRRDGGVLQSGPAGQGLTLSSGDALPPEVWLESTPGATVLVNGRPYEGRLRVLNQGDGLLVVNHLPLERYVASVVGAEMPSSWDLEALKAQAVAARSYALAHMARPASSHWHLGDTTRWQAYRGLNSVTSRTRLAAEQTAGLILSYQGGIVESLYAANSQISAEAHGHLGASMSQEGAQALASSGQRYNQILGHYYRGASLARLRLGAG